MLGCASVTAAHLAVLYTSGQDAAETSIAVLSRGPDGYLHGIGLVLFALAQASLAALLSRPGSRWPTRLAQCALVLDAALTLYIAWHFATASEAALQPSGPHVPLVLLASGTGFAMAATAPGLLASRRPAGLWNLGCLCVWLALVPLMALVDATTQGGYERLVGAVFILWMAGLAVLVGFTTGELPRASG